MISVVMFDLGETLIGANGQPFAHVPEALTAIGKMNVKSCLVSDFDMHVSVAAAMTQYLKVLDKAGLRQFFEPVNQRVTLSNHAKASKPAAKVFKKALQRLGTASTPFADCLFITENAAHIEAARNELKMKGLQFGVDFTDWSEVPAKISASGDWMPLIC